MSIVTIPGEWRQTIATLIVNLLSVHLGIGLADFIIDIDSNHLWVKSTLQQILQVESDSNDVHDQDVGSGNLTSYVIPTTELALLDKENVFGYKYEIAAGYVIVILLLQVLVLVMMPLAMYIGDNFGRKIAIAVSAILFVIAHLPGLVVFRDTSRYVRFSVSMISAVTRMVACGIQICQVPMYVYEISRQRRGPHRVFRQLLVVIGLSFGFFKNDLLKTSLATVLYLLAPLLLLVGLLILPESPKWLAMNKRFSAAERAKDWFQINDISVKNPTMSRLKLIVGFSLISLLAHVYLLVIYFDMMLFIYFHFRLYEFIPAFLVQPISVLGFNSLLQIIMKNRRVSAQDMARVQHEILSYAKNPISAFS